MIAEDCSAPPTGGIGLDACPFKSLRRANAIRMQPLVSGRMVLSIEFWAEGKAGWRRSDVACAPVAFSRNTDRKRTGKQKTKRLPSGGLF
jgi:hypothetical protein